MRHITWTAEMDAVLRREWEARTPASRIAKMIGVSSDHLANRRRYLKLKRRNTGRNCYKTHKSNPAEFCIMPSCGRVRRPGTRKCDACIAEATASSRFARP